MFVRNRHFYMSAAAIIKPSIEFSVVYFDVENQ